ncbi:MAG: hypothetical protein M1434_01465 [Chloroflexi bacterium]|nr:hypothetical protein [Chloroflexota bacterium]MCL5273399.1 hypothetical protein [Chloroflexota bacterium]
MRIDFIDQIMNPVVPQVARLYRDLRPGLREYLLRAHLPVRSRRGIGAEIDARLIEADRICDMLGQRHMRAYHAEKQGREQEAIHLYEQNVADGDLSTLSYTRLRLLYIKQKRYRDALRVCEDYLRTLDELAERDPDLPQWAIINRRRFAQHIADLRLS